MNMQHKKFTVRHRFIAAACNPGYGNYANVEEIKEAKLLARGRYWIEHEFEQYCAYSLSGRRAYFEFNLESPSTKKKQKYWKDCARKAARLWSQNRYMESAKWRV